MFPTSLCGSPFFCNLLKVRDYLCNRNAAVLFLVAQSCPTLCDPMDCSLTGSSVREDSSGQNTGVGCHALLQGIFRTQGLNPGLPNPGIGPRSPAWHTDSYCLSHQGKPKNTGVGGGGLVAKSCPTLCNSMNCSPPGSSVHEILQARILEWVAIPFSRGSSQHRNQTWISCIAGRFFTS